MFRLNLKGYGHGMKLFVNSGKTDVVLDLQGECPRGYEEMLFSSVEEAKIWEGAVQDTLIGISSEIEEVEEVE